MNNILVTGATGNVGKEVVKWLDKNQLPHTLALENEKMQEIFSTKNSVIFNFYDESTWENSIKNIDSVFLLRPPVISDVKKYIFPFLALCLSKNIKRIVFLSLQGVQFNIFTPHHKIEKYLLKNKADYTIIRPNFFMQNLSTIYASDIKENNEIFLPAGKGKTAFIDVSDIGEAVANSFASSTHIKKAYTLSGSESLDYWQVASKLSAVLGRQITYKNPSTKEYIKRLKEKGYAEDYIKVQKMLYFVVRHNFSASTASDAQAILGHDPILFDDFAKNNKNVWQ
jgi:uncharacterized protein YbjT (DUF2867 family)